MRKIKVGKHFVPLWIVAIISVSAIGLGISDYLWPTVNVPLEVKDPIEIINYPSGFSLFPGESRNFTITVQNNAPVNYSVILDFSLNDTFYQAAYVTFSHKVYVVEPGQHDLAAWLAVGLDAPAANVLISIAARRSESGWLSGFMYRKSHVIDSASNAGVNYQVEVIVHKETGIDGGANVYTNGHCRDDFGDVRFTKSDGITLLDYFMQGYSNGDQAIFWVKITDDLSTSDATIYIYYGNSNATTMSNGESTFIFFDDFANLNQWMIGNGNWSIENGSAKCTQDGYLKYAIDHSDGAIIYRAKVSQQVDYSRAIVIYRMNSDVTAAFRSGWGYHSELGGEMIFVDVLLTGWRAIASSQKSWNTGTWYTAEAKFAGSLQTFEFNGDGSPINAAYSTPQSGTFIGLQGSTATPDHPIWFDWVAYRKLVNPEPLHGIWGNEEQSGL